MNKRIIWVLLLLSLTITSTFAVVEQKDSMIDAANSLATRWIINNHSWDTENYKLYDNVLRQEIAAVARWVAWLEKKAKCDNIFADLSSTKPNTWACVNVEPLVDNNLISKNTNFRPEDKITKAESIAMLIKAIWFGYTLNTNSTKSWQQQVVEYAVSKWVVENFTDYDTPATRWWIFKVADTTIKTDEIQKKTYSDEVLLEIQDIIWIYQ